ncbi:malate synthase A [Desulfococcus sp.]|uniref:malate synthase A n=1 Tax=Desulfococcus sp. TaxID=2025834 RepID=UPI0035932E29
MDSPDTSQASSRASASPRVVPGSHFTAEDHPQRDRVLTPEALAFIGALHEQFASEVQALLARREHVQARISGGALPDFLAETRAVRDADWRVRELPRDLTDRRVEITGPTERKMVINALNSGARVFMADFEDSLSPTWANVLNGQVNLMDAVRRTISYRSPEGKEYRLGSTPAVLTVRPRGWHLVERHLSYNGAPTSGALVDFGLFLFHNAQALLERGTGAYLYLPKLESHREARLWAEIFAFSQKSLGLPPGSIRCTVLIETILAAFEMDEILYELRDYVAALNCGRWDYIFSFIKRFRKVPGYIFPDRAQITMTRHCMHSYSLLAVKTCHRRGAHAIGGMAAQIPIKGDPEANAAALQKVRDDKIREASDGHDGTWVAHPGLVALARAEFDRLMPRPNQVDRLREDVAVTRDDLLKVPAGTITEGGLRTNVRVGIEYMAAWLSGNGCVPLYNLMEDAATAEISRTQVWQWVHHPLGILEDGRKVTLDLFRAVTAEELAKIRAASGDEAFEKGNYQRAARLFDDIIANPEFADFLTLRAYELLE